MRLPCAHVVAMPCGRQVLARVSCAEWVSEHLVDSLLHKLDDLVRRLPGPPGPAAERAPRHCPDDIILPSS